jgi:tripartite-type tricarboxylate transporter receptor subunit TctC
VTIIVSSNPGGASDFVGRFIADELSKSLGQTFVVENRPGAASNVGAAALARSKPDGYTLGIIAPNSHGINPTLYKDLSYHYKNDFEPISQLTEYPNMLVVNPSVPASNLAELIELVKENPGKYTYASSGAGTTIHITAEMFKMATGTYLLHVPYNGGGPMKTALVSGEVDLAFDNLPNSLSLVEAGKLNGLAVTSKARSESAPDIPTIAETIPGFSAVSWHGLAAPAGVSEEVLDKVSVAVMEIMSRPEVQALFKQRGGKAVGSPREEFTAFIDDGVESWGTVVTNIGLSK